MNSIYSPHTPRLEAVDRYIRELFAEELPTGIKYHDAEHTLHPARGVVAVADKLALAENVPEAERELIIAAAYFHDSGYIREYRQNEPIAARMAGRILRLIGYLPDEIEAVQQMILSTDIKRDPQTLNEKILCDADLDNLGRQDFFDLDRKLREGRRARGVDVDDDLKWYEQTLEILQLHRYHTETQKKCRESGKQRNIRKLKEKIERIKAKRQ